MTLAFAAFTRRGEDLARRLAQQFGGSVTRIDKENPLSVWTAQQFSEKEGLVFVGAVGIAVRAIAPHLRHKTTDPAVVAVDEGGRFAIPLVSGHLGGANALAQAIAAHLGAIPVITTATDGRGLFAVDSWANAQGCLVKEPERIKWVSSKVLDGKQIQLRCPWPISGEKPDEVSLTEEEACDAAVTLYQEENTALHLLPKALTLGVGCRKGTSQAALENAYAALLAEQNFAPEAFVQAASIDLKANEPGLLAFCARRGLPLTTYSAEALAAVAGDFTPSAFVQGITGVDNVCERAAAAAGGRIIVPKQANNGVTAAVTGEGAIGGSSSFKIDYPDTEDWLLAARTDESKVKLPAFHRYVIKFDYKTLSGDTRLNLTIRPKATMLDETVSFGFETIKLKAGESGTYEGHIDVMSPSADNVLLLLGEDTAFSVLIDNLSITEG